jgi:YD repeat-containing protein
MYSRLKRGKMLRVISVFAGLSLVAAVPVVMAPAAIAAPSSGNIVAPPTVWTPPTTINRTMTGGAPPATPWRQRTKTSTPAPAARTNTATPPGCPSFLGQPGVLSDRAFERFTIDDRMQMLVNLCTGNLVVTDRLLTVHGTGENLALNQVYNNASLGGVLGAGWTLNAGSDMGLTVNGTTVTLDGDSNYEVPFTQKPDGSYNEAPGLHATLTKNSDGAYTVRFDSTGEVWSFSAQGWLTSEADRNGNATSYQYTSSGVISSVTDSQGRVTTANYDSAGNLGTITDPTGTVAARYAYNSSGWPTQFTDRDGRVVTFGYKASCGCLNSITDPNGGTYAITFDSTNSVTKVTVPRTNGGAVSESFGYATDASGNTTTTETDPNGHASVYHIDVNGHETSLTDPLGHDQAKTWTPNGDVLTTTDGLNNSTTAQYDSLDNQITAKLPTGATTAIGYTNTALPHSPTSVTDPAGDQVTTAYDTAGNPTTLHSVGLNADIEVRTYNAPKGTLATDKDGNGHVTTYGYDGPGNLTSVTPPAPAGVTHYSYDSLSRVISITDGNGKKIDYSYDKLDRVVAITQDNGAVLQTSTYDANGNLVSGQTPVSTTKYTYDTYPTSNLVTSATRTQSGTSRVVSYGYDNAGNLRSLTDQAGTTTYGYDAANRLTSLADPFGQNTGFGYDAANHRVSTTWPGAGAETVGYDPSGRETGLTVKNTTGTVLLSTGYDYTTAAGKDSDQMQSSTRNGAATAYAYDPDKRLKQAGATTFINDNAGNLTALGGAGFTVNAADQFTIAGGDNLGFDSAGNVTTRTTGGSTTTFGYSSTNQLVNATAGGTQVLGASYDTTDQTQRRTVTEQIGATAYDHTFGESALGIVQDLENGASSSYARDPRGTLTTMKSSAGTRYSLITDYQGSVIGMLDTSGNLAATYSYNPYGATSAAGPAAGDNHFRWLGNYQLQGGRLPDGLPLLQPQLRPLHPA